MDTLPSVLARRAIACAAILAVSQLFGCATQRATPKRSANAMMFDLRKYTHVQKRPDQDPDTTVVVAISGGGYRAANLGIGALLALEKIEIGDCRSGPCSNLLREVDYFTTVSGGGLAAGTYMQGLLSTPPAQRGNFNFDRYLAGRNAEAGTATPGKNSARLESVQKTLFWRILGYSLTPRVLFKHIDRGDYLQDRFDRTVLKRDDCAQVSGNASPCSWLLGDVFRPASDTVEPTTPYWITNATNYVSGEIFAFTPDNLCARGVISYIHNKSVKHTKCTEGLALDVPLSLGMRTSSNFPVGLPATTLELAKNAPDQKKNPQMKLSDGGQADNLAFYSALEILYQDMKISQEEIKKKSNSSNKSTEQPKPRRRLLILIDAFNGGLGNTEDGEGSPSVFEMLARSPFLPMDALRSRLYATLSEVDSFRRSEVDSVLLDGNLSVAYINIDDESTARTVGTTFWLEKSEQDELISAGYRQAHKVLTGKCEAPLPRIETLNRELSCHLKKTDKCTDSASRPIIEFNQTLVMGARRDIDDARHQALTDLSAEIENFNAEIKAEVAADAISRILSDEIGKAVNQNFQENLTRSQRISNEALGDGAPLRQVVERFKRVYSNLPSTSTPPFQAKDRETLRTVTCLTIETHNRLFPRKIQNRPLSCDFPFHAHDTHIDRVLHASGVVRHLVSACGELRPRLDLDCQPLSNFYQRTVLSMSALQRELRSFRTSIMQTPSAPSDAVAPQSSCEASEQLDKLFDLTSDAATTRFDIRNPVLDPEKIERDSKLLQLTKESIPCSMRELTRKCGELDQLPARRKTALDASYSRLIKRKKSALCVLSKMNEAWPKQTDRIRTNVGEIFAPGKDTLFCGRTITTVPTSKSFNIEPLAVAPNCTKQIEPPSAD